MVETANFNDGHVPAMSDRLTCEIVEKIMKAHQSLDRAVMKLYGFGKDASEAKIVAKLMVMYQKLATPPSLIQEPPKVVRKGRKKIKGE